MRPIPSLRNKISKIKGIIFDLDGCIYIGDRPVEGAVEIVSMVRSLGYRILFLTNNSSLSREGYVRKLRGMGIDTSIDEVLTSGYATAKYILERYGPSNILAITENGFIEEAIELGHNVLPISMWEKADILVAGLDREFNYQKLRAALRAVLKGAIFIATNEDRTLPTELGPDPGAGSIVAAISFATNVKPIIIGKPSRIIMDMALDIMKMRPKDVMLVGDRLETDVMAAKSSGMVSVLISDRRPKKGPKPDFVIGSISSLAEILRKK